MSCGQFAPGTLTYSVFNRDTGAVRLETLVGDPSFTGSAIDERGRSRCSVLLFTTRSTSVDPRRFRDIANRECVLGSALLLWVPEI